jgi:hypothetical protein
MSVMNEHVLREKGGGFVAGGDIPDNIRTTAWQFMGQEIPANFGKLVFGTPLVKKDDFDPAAESSYGLLSASTEKRRNLNKLISQWRTHLNSHPDIQEALRTERNL